MRFQKHSREGRGDSNPIRGDTIPARGHRNHMNSMNLASPTGSNTAGSVGTTPRRLNTANAATQNPQAGTRFISSCNRCRRRKIKCDAGIPSCQACADSNTTCEFHDLGANTDLPRARIIGLEQHLQHLLSLQAQTDRQALIGSGNITVDGVVQPEFRGRLVVSGIRLACGKLCRFIRSCLTDTCSLLSET